LRPSGRKLADGITINSLPSHIPLNETFSGVKNWDKAIFVLPVYFIHLILLMQKEL